MVLIYNYAAELPKMAKAILQFVSVPTSVIAIAVPTMAGQPVSVITVRESPA
jgi:tryptophanase